MIGSRTETVERVNTQKLAAEGAARRTGIVERITERMSPEDAFAVATAPVPAPEPIPSDGALLARIRTRATRRRRPRVSTRRRLAELDREMLRSIDRELPDKR